MSQWNICNPLVNSAGGEYPQSSRHRGSGLQISRAVASKPAGCGDGLWRQKEE